MLRRSALREIRATKGRFLAILSIIALGVGFFTGVRGTTPAMRSTVNKFWQEHQLYDYRLISTLGWDEENVAAFQEQEGVRYAEGAQTLDALFEDIRNNEYVFKTHSIPEHVNGLELVEGRMPERANECLMDAGFPNGLSVGDCVYVSYENDEDTHDAFTYGCYTIVGAVHSSYYLNFERGTSTIGNGTVSAYLYLTPEGYDREYYSEIFIRFDQDDMIYSDAYKDAMDARTETWEELTQEQADARWQRILDDANEELQEGKDKLEENRAEGQQKLDDAAQELADGKAELDDAAQKLADGKAELDDAAQKLSDAEAQLADAKQKLEDAEIQLADAKLQVEDGQVQLDNAKAQLDASGVQLDAAAQTLADSENTLRSGQEQLNAAKAQLDANERDLLTQEQALNAQEAELNAMLPLIDQLPEEQAAQIQAGLEQIAQARPQIEAGKSQISAARSELASKQAELDAGWERLNAGKSEYEQGRAAYDEGVRKYQESLAAWEQGKAEYESGVADYEQGKLDYESGVADYEQGKLDYEDGVREYEDGVREYEDGLAEYEDGVKKYEDGKSKFEEKIAKAEDTIADAEAEIADITRPDTYVLDRSTNIGYACFESDSQIVEQVARVFPLFFILVAALVCMTTMSRMVEEQRTSIGTLKALGYSEGQIMGKFAFYAGSAAVIGCILGFGVGSVLFPNVIWMSYELMYIPIKLAYRFDAQMAVLALMASLLCSIGTTWLSCRIELSETAAGLMRPKAPKAGKRVFLEYLPWLWNKLKFLHKVSIRNILRYKGRFFMMVLGIGGCTALLVTGFGLRDSISDFAQVQYNEIVVADANVSFKSGLGTALPEELETSIAEGSAEYLLLHQTTLDLVTKDKVKGMNIIAPLETENFDHYMHLHTMQGEPLSFPGYGEAYVSNSIQERYHVNVGDTITLRREDMREVHVTVTGVFENHVYNYILMTSETLSGQLREETDINTAFINFPADADSYQIAAEIGKDEHVAAVTLYDELMERMAKMMSSLNYIVALVIACAAGLAFIVLYNLTNINITERIREIATIKVLGFFRNETEAYVLRENLVLTAIGILAGLGLGILLHRFVISQIIVDLVSFKVQILPLSYLWSIALTFGFNLAVNLVMGIKLDRINMAESLKSME